jgi:hypothetical protein
MVLCYEVFGIKKNTLEKVAIENIYDDYKKRVEKIVLQK